MHASRVQLVPHELDMAATVGVRRQVAAIRDGRKDRHGLDPENGWKVHIEGALGELAVAKFLGRYWDGSVDTFRTLPDLGKAEIRTRTRHEYELYLRRDDDPGKTYILVTGLAPDLWVRGFIRGADGMLEKNWKNHGGRGWAWFIPTADLRTDWPEQVRRGQ